MYKPIYIASLLILTLSGCSFGPHPCDDTTTLKILARAYTLSVDPFDPGAFKAFIAKGPEAFSADGRVVQCAREFSAALGEKGAGRYSSDRAMADNINYEMQRRGFNSQSSVTTGGAMLLTAQELGWLAEILPPAAEGDFSAFDRGNPLRKEIDNLAKDTAKMTELLGMGKLTSQLRAQQRQANEEFLVQLGQQLFANQ
jgi:hypothetical protein